MQLFRTKALLRVMIMNKQRRDYWQTWERPGIEGIIKKYYRLYAFLDLGGLDGLLYITDISWDVLIIQVKYWNLIKVKRRRTWLRRLSKNASEAFGLNN